MLLHIDPSTPLGALDALGHLAPLWASLTGSGAFLALGRLLDRHRGGR
jgi:hypothetical protein